MAGKTLADALARERLASVGLITLWNTLEITISQRLEDPFDALLLLVRNGLIVTDSKGDPVNPDVLSDAIAIVKSAHERLIDACFDDPDPRRVPTRLELALIWKIEVIGTSLGLLKVRESDYAAACSDAGLTTYWWPLMTRAQSKTDLEERTVNEAASNDPHTCTGDESGFLALDDEAKKVEDDLSSAGNLDVIVDTINESVTVVPYDRPKKRRVYSRGDIVGRGSVTWDLLVDFAKCKGSLEGNNNPDVVKRNSSVNRKNLNEKMIDAMRLKNAPILKGRSGAMGFRSIILAGGKKRIDALDRLTISTDKQATEYLARHGDDIPTI